MNADFVFNSGSVTPGHPDKLCDSISDAIVDAYLSEDPAARVVAECAVSGGVVFLSLRSNAEATVDVAEVARRVVADTGYVDGEFNAEDCSVMISQSTLPAYSAPRVNLAGLADADLDSVTARHQVTLFGYACNQTENLMPLPIELAHRLVRALAAAAARHQDLMPDGQAQVGVAYRGRQPLGVNGVSLVVAQRAAEGPSPGALRELLLDEVVRPVMQAMGLGFEDGSRVVVNPGGPMVGGGPAMHSGLTGRKTAIDAYGEYARQSGAALSGKDPLRIDRIGAYVARHAAKTVVAAGLAAECEVQISYSIGRTAPSGLCVQTFGTGTVDDGVLTERVRGLFDLRPGAIARDYRLQALPAERGGFFQALATFGQIGREDLDVPWERLDRVDALRG